MSSKREKMRMRAREELGNKSDSGAETSTEMEKEAPSMISNFFYVFAGTLVSFWLLTQNQVILAMAIGTPFIIIGLRRMYKASSARYRKSTLAKMNNSKDLQFK